MEQGGPSNATGDEVEEGDEASSMDISGSIERPPHPQRTPHPQGWERRHHRIEMDDLINNMGTMQIEQEAICSWQNKMPNFCKQYKLGKHNVGMDASNIICHHSEQKPSLGEILSTTKISILS